MMALLSLPLEALISQAVTFCRAPERTGPWARDLSSLVCEMGSVTILFPGLS